MNIGEKVMGFFDIFKKKVNDFSEVKQKLKRLFEINPRYTDFGDDSGMGESVALYPENIFERVQLGYLVDSDGLRNKEWIGKNYYVVGGYGMFGDVLITDISNDSFPIFALPHDDWDKVEMIAKSVEDFSKIIGLINNADINNNDECEKLKTDISKIINTDFWAIEIDSAKI